MSLLSRIVVRALIEGLEVDITDIDPSLTPTEVLAIIVNQATINKTDTYQFEAFKSDDETLESKTVESDASESKALESKTLESETSESSSVNSDSVNSDSVNSDSVNSDSSEDNSDSVNSEDNSDSVNSEDNISDVSMCPFDMFQCHAFVDCVADLCRAAEASSDALLHRNPGHVLVAADAIMDQADDKETAEIVCVQLVIAWINRVYEHFDDVSLRVAESSHCAIMTECEKAVEAALTLGEEYVILYQPLENAALLRNTLRRLDVYQKIKFVIMPANNAKNKDNVTCMIFPDNTYVRLAPASAMPAHAAPLFMHPLRIYARCATYEDAVVLVRASLRRYYSWMNMPLRLLRYAKATLVAATTNQAADERGSQQCRRRP